MHESDLQRQVTELCEQRAAISEVLRAIANSPHELQPIFDAILDSATRLCRAEAGTFRLVEEGGRRLVAHKLNPAVLEGYAPPMLRGHGSFVGHLIAGKLPVHIPDLAAHELYRAGEASAVGLVKGGVRTALFVPMIRNDELIGSLSIGRQRVEHFTEKEIELVTDFAAQATIALESTRRERRYRETQTALAHANRVATMGQLTASVAHEVKQPLAAASVEGEASLNWLTRNTPEIEEAKECVARLRNHIDRAVRIIDRIHQLVRKTGREKQRLEVNETIVEVIELAQGEILKNGVAIRTELADCLPPIQGDRVQFQQVILNLIINSLQAMSNVNDGKRELVVATGVLKPEEAIHVAVRDSGPGLSVENIERVFQPFYSTKPDGMGMGLSICREIIEDHGGRLWASANVPCGATFQFTLPASPYNAP